MIPSANNCAPEKIATMDARNAKPGTAAPWIGKPAIASLMCAERDANVAGTWSSDRAAQP